jgi:hypothetical protein
MRNIELSFREAAYAQPSNRIETQKIRNYKIDIKMPSNWQFDVYQVPAEMYMSFALDSELPL